MIGRLLSLAACAILACATVASALWPVSGFGETSGFFAVLNRDDPSHDRARALPQEAAARRRGGVESVTGETCTFAHGPAPPGLDSVLSRSRGAELLPY